MVIKVSTLLQNNTILQEDTAPVLGGALNTNNFPIQNGGNPVTITGNKYPTNTGSPGQILTTDGFGNLSWTLSGNGTVTSVGVQSIGTYAGAITIGSSPITTSGVITITPNIFSTSSTNYGVVPGSNGQTSYFLRGDGIWAAPGSSSLSLYSENPQIGYTPPDALGANSVAIGYAAIANSTKSLAIGEQSYSRITGGVVQASGRFTSSGDAQTGKYMVRTITSGTVPQIAFVDGPSGSIQLNLVDYSTWTFRAMVVAQRTDTPSGWAGYELKGVIYRAAGAATTVLQGVVTNETISSNNPSWKVTATADNVNGALNFTCTGSTGMNVRWVISVDTVEVTN